MPPKKVTMAPGSKPGVGTKPDTKAKQNNKMKDTGKLNPFQRSTKNMSRAGDIRKQRDAYNQIIAEEQAQKAREIKDLEDKIVFYKKENEKLLRQQTVKFGMALDDMKDVKEELEQARVANDTLYREVESRKEECDKLQIEMDSVLRKINELMIESTDLNRERRIFEQEREQVARNEIKIHKLYNANRELRVLLLKHKINPNTDASRIHTSPAVTNAPKKHVKSTSPRSEPSQRSSTLPVIYNKNNLLSFRSEEEMRPLQKKVPKGILRRTKSNNPTEYISAREFLTRRPSYPWTRAVNVII